MTKWEMFEVGGCVRDELLGLPVKDIDYMVVGPESFDAMCFQLVQMGFHLWDTNEHTLTARARFPKDWEFAGREFGNLSADIVLARAESGYADGRHPDSVKPGTFQDDILRRDFSVNALAKDKDGNIIDIVGGMADLRDMRLRAIGGVQRSFTDDTLRVLRALRFYITKGFWLDDEIWYALDSDWLVPLVAASAHERRQDELDKMFKFDSSFAIAVLAGLRPVLREAIFSGFRLTTTAKKVK